MLSSLNLPVGCKGRGAAVTTFLGMTVIDILWWTSRGGPSGFAKGLSVSVPYLASRRDHNTICENGRADCVPTAAVVDFSTLNKRGDWILQFRDCITLCRVCLADLVHEAGVPVS